MAWLEQRNGRYRIKFRYGQGNFQCALKTENRREAEALLGRLEDNLILLERGKLEPPADGDLALFLISDGKINTKPKVEPSISLAELFKRYQDLLPDGIKEANTRSTERVHMRHLERLIGRRTGIRSITSGTLQDYIDRRSKEKGRSGEVVNHVTIQKELGTLGSIWNKWALPHGIVSAPAPTRGLVYGKSRAKFPFQTWEQIERRIKRGGLTKREEAEVWDCLFLSLSQIRQLLDHVKNSASAPFVYAMFVFGAHTGARRSEMLRAQIDDFDFDGGVVRIREKKRDRSKQLTFRHVPLSPLLTSVMREWFSQHPGGQLVICDKPGVSITPQMSAHHFIWAVEGSRWDKLKGWHVLRHSFISNCAAKGIDQRVIDSWSGHQTGAMRQRYTHLFFPEQQKKAMSMVFSR